MMYMHSATIDKIYGTQKDFNMASLYLNILEMLPIEF
jgi:hypothetical protein